MRQIKLTLVAPAMALSFALMPMHSMAMGTAQEGTQMMNNLQLVKTLAETVKIVTETAKTAMETQKLMNNAATNTAAVADTEKWTNVRVVLENLSKVVGDGNSLAFAAANSEDAFKQKFPGFVPTTDVKQQYRDWSKTLNDSIRASMARANIQAADFDTEANTLKSLEELSRTATGRMQAIQVGNQIAIQSATQMQKLRGLMVAQMQAQDAYMANQEQKDASRKAGAEVIMPTGKAGQGKTYETFKGGSLK